MVFLAALPLATRAAVALAVLLFLAAHVAFFWRRTSARAVGMRNGGGETMGARVQHGVQEAVVRASAKRILFRHETMLKNDSR